MLLPARTAPVGSLLLIALGIGESIFIGYRQIQIRKEGMSVTRAVVADFLVPAPLLAGIVGLLQPHSEFPFLLIAIMAGVGLFLLFAQSWTLVLHSIISTDAAQPRSGNSPQDSKKDDTKTGSVTRAGPA